MRSRLQHWLLPHKGNKHRPVLLKSRGFFTLSLIAAVWNLVLLGALHLPQLHSVLGYRTSIEPIQVIQEINNERRLAGLPPYKANEQLNQAAQAKATDMLARQYWSHNAPDGTEPWRFIDDTGYEYTVAGENLAKNFSSTDSMIKAWMDSPTHKANIVHEQYSQTGVAVVEGELEGVPTVLVVQMFARPYAGQPALVDSQKTNRPNARTNDHNNPTARLNEATANASSSGNLLGSTTKIENQPAYQPLQMYRLGLLAVLTFLVTVLVHDLWIDRKKNLKRTVGKNIAHIVIIVAVIITLAVAETGAL